MSESTKSQTLLHGHSPDALPESRRKTLLEGLAKQMAAERDEVDLGPDAEENVFVPAGYTYFGQFIDHDLTFDATSSLDGRVGFSNQRTPRLDLDCVYGGGPGIHPYLYHADGVRLLEGDDFGGDRHDLPRMPNNRRAVIGDPRNDENSIVNQIHAAFLHFHNEVVARLRQTTRLSGHKLFERARHEVRWSYQRIVTEDFLPRLINADVAKAFDKDRQPDRRGHSTNAKAFKLFPDTGTARQAIPLIFAGAAYRFGHSMVRNGYVLQDGFRLRIFEHVAESLLGFEPLSARHLIRDWSRFFPDSSREGDGTVFAPGKAPKVNDSAEDAAGHPRLQWAYKMDPSIVDPLAHLPSMVASDKPRSLILRNLLRGEAFKLPSGQAVAKQLRVPSLTPAQLVVRRQISQGSHQPKRWQFQRIDPAFDSDTPLWFYILAEAQAPQVDHFGDRPLTEDDLKGRRGCRMQLGAVGGRILLEVFNGLLDSDPESCRNHGDAARWKPMLKKFRMWDLLHFRA